MVAGDSDTPRTALSRVRREDDMPPNPSTNFAINDALSKGLVLSSAATTNIPQPETALTMAETGSLPPHPTMSTEVVDARSEALQRDIARLKKILRLLEKQNTVKCEIANILEKHNVNGGNTNQANKLDLLKDAEVRILCGLCETV